MTPRELSAVWLGRERGVALRLLGGLDHRDLLLEREAVPSQTLAKLSIEKSKTLRCVLALLGITKRNVMVCTLTSAEQTRANLRPD